MSDRYLANNAADRALGEKWEGNFCHLAAWYGKAFHAVQLDRQRAARWQKGNRPALLPDVTIFTSPGEHHEVKHKNPSRRRAYGYETYRLKSLLLFHQETRQPVFYSIHDWELAGARTSDAPMPNVLQDWRVIDVCQLEAFIRSAHLEEERMGTWINAAASTCFGYYWPTSLWIPLDEVWGLPY